MKKINFKIKISKKNYLFLLLIVPVISFAAAPPPPAPTELKDLICTSVFVALDFIPLIVVFAFGAMLQGLVKYVANGDNEEKRAEGRKLMIYGVVGFFFMVSVWGVIEIFANSYSIKFGIPQFNQGSNGTKGCYRAGDGSVSENPNATIPKEYRF